MANFVYTNWKLKVGQKAEALGGATPDTLKVALFTSTYVPNQDTDTTYAGITGEVAAGNGYTTGGVTLASVVWAADATNHRAKLTASNISWTVTAAITYRYAVLYDSTTGDLIALFDPGANQTGPSSGTININWDATNGVLTLT